MPKFCPNCGEEISDKVKFCPKCGANIDTFSIKKDEKSYPKWFYGVMIIAIIIVLLGALSIFSAFSAGMQSNIQSSPKITSSPTIVTTPKMVVTTTPPGAPPTEVTQIKWTSSVVSIQMIGGVYGLATTPTAGIELIAFGIGLAPGAPSIDLTKMKIIFTKSGSAPIILTHGDTPSNTVFITKIGTNSVTSMNPNDQVVIMFKIDGVPANTKMNFELRPSVGAALTFSKTAPATITNTMVLY